MRLPPIDTALSAVQFTFKLEVMVQLKTTGNAIPTPMAYMAPILHSLWKTHDYKQLEDIQSSA